MADERSEFERAARAVEALGDVSTRDKLDLLLMAWLVEAMAARNEQLPFPDGFTTEQQRQLQQLAVATEMIRAAVPDLEGERLQLEGDLEGWRRHMQQRLREAQDPDGDSEPKGGA